MEQPNLNYLKSLSNGNTLLEERFLLIIKNEFPVDVEEFYQYLQEKHYSAASKKVHKIKHKIAFLGLENGCKTAILFENNLKNYATDLLPEFEAILETINEFIKTLDL